MIIVTSLSPNHTNATQQILAIKSWQPYGECFSLNKPEEIELITNEDIYLIRTDKTIGALIGKPLVSINAMIDYAISKDEDLLLINSDIIIDSLPEFKTDGITILSRHDYTNSFEDGKMFDKGFDAFYIGKDFLKIYPPSIYAMGICFWDLWIPYQAMKAGIPVYHPQGRYIFHKVHPVQYPMDEWFFIGEFFKWQFKFNKVMTVPQVTTEAMRQIQMNVIKI